MFSTLSWDCLFPLAVAQIWVPSIVFYKNGQRGVFIFIFRFEFSGNFMHVYWILVISFLIILCHSPEETLYFPASPSDCVSSLVCVTRWVELRLPAWGQTWMWFFAGTRATCQGLHLIFSCVLLPSFIYQQVAAAGGLFSIAPHCP